MKIAPFRDAAPDYTQETFDKRWPVFKALHQKLKEIDTAGWTIPHQVDWHIVHAEMNGYDFNHRILKPWQRDPAFYTTIWTDRSDVPAHEGPTHHAVLDLWKYEFPLNKEQRKKLIEQLTVIPSLNEQAKLNLTGNAKDLWIAGIRDIKTQSQNLENMKQLPGIAKDKKIDDRPFRKRLPPQMIW